ncbi:MAG: flagellar basal-body rod protein FlgG [Alphaproteobacteria bacterium]|jgi:flagellar basal-body rod protein FlgG|nr:flagellar basal-body rod protein FlgG [Alphaproteobacteria bacterium]MBP9878409.1 flagellar basal-body rod protein FlgG [Alphaproteobacteria bacterium]
MEQLAMRIAASGMTNAQATVDTISQNIANLRTTAFKRHITVNKTTPYRIELRPGTVASDTGALVPSGIQIGTGVKLSAISRILTEGQMTQTESQLDMAIHQKGYFQIAGPNDETIYTRDGNFTRNELGQIVTQEGYLLIPTITIPQNAVDVTVNTIGEVIVKLDGVIAPTTIGQIQIATFINENGLEELGENYFGETPASGNPVVGIAGSNGFGKILQSNLENSNVEVVSELTELISAQRAYEMNSRIISAEDQMLSALTNLR